MNRLLAALVLLAVMVAPKIVWAQEETEYVAGNIANALIDLQLIESERATGKVPKDFAASYLAAKQASLQESYARADRSGQASRIRRDGARRAAVVLAARRQTGFLEGFPDPQTVAQDVRREAQGEDEMVLLGRIAGRYQRLAKILENNNRAVWDSQMPPAAARLKRLYNVYSQDIIDRVNPTLEDGCGLKKLFGTCKRSNFWNRGVWDPSHAEALARLYIPEKNKAAFLDAQGPGFSQAERRVELAAAARQPKAHGVSPEAIAPIVFGVGMIILVVGLYIKSQMPKPTPLPQATTNYGSAGFRGYTPLKDDQEPLSGVFLGKQSGPSLPPNYQSAPLFTTPKSHTLIVAPTRTGKGTRVIVPTLLRYGGSMVVIDPKGENAAITAGSRRRFCGQQVFVLNPWNVLSAAFEARQFPSASFNPLDVIRANDPNAVSIAQGMADAICKRSGSGDSAYWEGNAASILTAVMLWLADEPGEKLTIARLREIVTTPLEDLVKTYFLRMAASSAFGGAIKESIGPFLGLDHRPLGSILTTLQEATRFMSDPQLKRATASSDFDVRKLTSDKITLYLVIPPDRMVVQSTWLRMVLAAVTNAFRHAEVRNTRCMMLIDEFPALGPMPDLPTDLATLAGYGLDFTLIVQDLGQLEKHYGQLARSIINGCAWKWFSNVSDIETAKYVSETLGKRTIVTTSRSDSAESSSTSYNEMGRDLMTPDEVMRAGRDIAIAFIAGQTPAYLRTLDYWDIADTFSWLRDSTMQKYFEAPFVFQGNPYEQDKQGQV